VGVAGVGVEIGKGKEPDVGVAGVFRWVAERRPDFMEIEEVEGWEGEATGRQGGGKGRRGGGGLR
jgi:hypothetical protein